MNNFVFKIFGAPYTFDLYKGNEGEVLYFQNFDNGSKENTKLTIHRMASGKVSYSYLRYNFITSGGRPNSFFGMSVVFDGEYCKSVRKIFDLFDAVYKGIIVKNGILLTELKDNPNKAQAKYLVRSFAEAEGEVKNVEKNIIDNLNKHFEDDIVPLGNIFIESTSSVTLDLYDGDAAIINALRKCSWVHLIPGYSGNKEPIPSPEFLKALDNTIEEVQKQIPAISVRVVKEENVQGEINAWLDKIQDSSRKIDAWLETEYKLQKSANLNPYLQKQPELKERREKLLEIQKPLNDLSNAVQKTTAPKPQPQPPNDGTIETGGATPPAETGKGNAEEETKTLKKKKGYNEIFNFYKTNKIVVWGVVVLVAIVVLFVIFNPFSEKQPKIAQEPEKNAEPAVKDTVKPTTAEVPPAADSLQYWWDKAAAADRAKNYQDALKYLDNAERCNNGRYDVDAYKKEIQQKIDDAAKAEQKHKEEVAKKNAEDDKKKADDKKTAAKDNCSIIRNRSFEKGKPATDWTADTLLKEAKTKLDAGSTTVTIDMCNAIISKQKNCPDFATKEQLDKAKSYISRAQQ